MVHVSKSNRIYKLLLECVNRLELQVEILHVKLTSRLVVPEGFLEQHEAKHYVGKHRTFLQYLWKFNGGLEVASSPRVKLVVRFNVVLLRNFDRVNSSHKFSVQILYLVKSLCFFLITHLL